MDDAASTFKHERLVHPSDFATAPHAARPLAAASGIAPLPWRDSHHPHQPEPAWLNWPALAVGRIRAAAQELHAMSDMRTVVEDRSRYSEPEPVLGGYVARVATSTGVGAAAPVPDAVLVQVRDVIHAMDNLSQEFRRACTWLADAAKSGWEGTWLERPPRGVASVLGEPHRIIVQDWFLSDTSYLIGWLLHRVARQLQSFDEAQTKASGGPIQSRPCTEVLGEAAEMLERAGALAGECIFFAEQSRLRWMALREQVDHALAESRQADPDGPSTPAPLFVVGRTWR